MFRPTPALVTTALLVTSLPALAAAPTPAADALALLEKEVKARTPLETVDLHFFLVPLPSVQAFRDAFLKELGNG